VLYPFVGLLLKPMIAAAAMSVSSVSVIVNRAPASKHADVRAVVTSSPSHHRPRPVLFGTSILEGSAPSL